MKLLPAYEDSSARAGRKILFWRRLGRSLSRALDHRSNRRHSPTRRARLNLIFSVLVGSIACAGAGSGACAQDRISLKSGESVELHPVYWVANCRSIMIGIPEVEILEGPSEVALRVKEGMVLPRRQNCAKEVPGGTLVATTTQINEPKQGKLTYRLKYKTKDGARQTSRIYEVSLFP